MLLMALMAPMMKRPLMPDPQPLGMPSPDFISHQLREARSESVSLAAKNERLVAALTAARERITELGVQLDAVTLPPVTLGLLTGLPARPQAPEAGSGDAAAERPYEVDVMLGGRPMRLGLHASLEADSLVIGQLVAVSDQMLVVDALPAPDTGEAVTLEEVLPPRSPAPPAPWSRPGEGQAVLSTWRAIWTPKPSRPVTPWPRIRVPASPPPWSSAPVSSSSSSPRPLMSPGTTSEVLAPRSTRSETPSNCRSPTPICTGPTVCALPRDCSCTVRPVAARR